jgi:hypothetical protein
MKYTEVNETPKKNSFQRVCLFLVFGVLLEFPYDFTEVKASF